jgi:hypothetical protein
MIKFSHGTNKFDNCPQQKTVNNFAEFADWLKKNRSETKGGYYFCAPLEIGSHSDPQKNEGAKTWRQKHLAKERAFLPFDCDAFANLEEASSFLKFLEDYEHLWYETASSTEEKPRLRAVIALSEEVTQEKSNSIAAALINEFNNRYNLNVEFDHSVFNHFQPCYNPTTGRDLTYWSDGEPFDTRVVAAEPKEHSNPQVHCETTETILSHTPLADAHLIADQCSVIGLMKSTQGQLDEPTWRNCLGVLKHTVEGEKICHAWSTGDSRYSHAETQSKIDKWTTGPTTCKQFRDTHPSLCSSCPHDIVSPISLGVTATHTERPPQQLDLPLIYSGCDLAKMEFPPVKWIIEDLLPQGCYIFAGRPKLGKSWLGLQLAGAVASGSKFLNKNVTRGTSVIFGLEDNLRRFKGRLKALDIDLTKLTDLKISTDLKRTENGGREQLEALLQQLKPRLVVIDTLARIRTAQTNKVGYSEDYNAIAPFQDLANKYECCILVVTHTRKSDAPSEDPLETITGTLGISGAADGVVVLEGNRSSSLFNLHLIGRDIADTEPLTIRKRSTGGWDYEADGAKAILTQERQAIVDLLTLHGPLGAQEIADELSKKTPATRKLLREMKASGIVFQKNNRGVYMLPTHISNNSIEDAQT